MNPLLSLDSSSTESDFFMWSIHQNKVVRAAIILRPSSIQHNYQEQWQGRPSLSPPSLRWSRSLSQSIRISMNLQFHKGLAVNIQSCLNDLNLPSNPFNVLATMAVTRAAQEYSPQSLEISIPSPILTPPMSVRIIEGWETTHITTDDTTFYSEVEPRRVFLDISSSETFDSNEPRHVSITSSPSSAPPPPRPQKRKLSMGMSFPQQGGVSQHTCDACGQPLQAKKTP